MQLKGFFTLAESEADRLRKALDQVAITHGPWTAHSIHVGHGVHTFQPSPDSRLRQILQTARDLLGGLDGCKVLDLACLEGQLGIEFALQGAHVVGVEAREANIEKARVTKELLNLHTLELRLQDIRKLNSGNTGKFDVILCAGILYHLDVPDSMELLNNLFEMCDGILIIDSHTSPPKDWYEWQSKKYYGKFRKEHPDGATPEQKSSSLWYSVDNDRAFQFTESSLCNLLQHIGFTTVLKSMLPYRFWYEDWPAPSGRHLEMEGRITLIAVKGTPVRLLSSPATNDLPQVDRPEAPEFFGYERIRTRWLRRIRKLGRMVFSTRRRGTVSLHGDDKPMWSLGSDKDITK